MTQAPPAPTNAMLRLKLYVAGDSPNSVAAVKNLRDVLAGNAPTADLEIIDVLADPKRGLADGVLVTPMLIKVDPAPVRRIVGNLSNRDALLTALGVASAP